MCNSLRLSSHDNLYIEETFKAISTHSLKRRALSESSPKRKSHLSAAHSVNCPSPFNIADQVATIRASNILERRPVKLDLGSEIMLTVVADQREDPLSAAIP